MGFSIGITGWICDERRGKELQDAVRIIPLDRILVETDAPYLTPRNVPGLDRTNVPKNSGMSNFSASTICFSRHLT